ncbi:MAG: SH3 domain-containing protein [Clostridiales bacterium]|nr:SH3 domain-containing protein [Clostridiales bacterium]
MKRVLIIILAAALCLPALHAAAWGPQNYIEENALPRETLYVLDGQTLVQAIDELPYLYVLTEDAAGCRSLTIFRDNSGEYLSVAKSAPLPEISGIKPSIIANCILYSEALLYIFEPDTGGIWRLCAVQSKTDYRCKRYWLIEGDFWQGRLLHAENTAPTLAEFDPLLYPPGLDAAAKTLNTDGYALVNNPNPEDRLHLREEPSRASVSKGKYYNGTPVLILDDLGDWVKVSVAGVEGYMMKQYLALGADMLSVQPAFADIWVRKEFYGQDLNVYVSPDSGSELAGVLHDCGEGRVYITVIGLVGDDWVHVITGNGIAGFMQAEIFGPGNG